MNNVLVLPQLESNLISVGKLTDESQSFLSFVGHDSMIQVLEEADLRG